MSAQILTCSTAEYLDDPCPTPSLSSSIAHILINRSPMHARLRHPRLGGVPMKPTREMDDGSIAHALILGTGKGIAVVEADDWRTKKAKDERDGATAEGKVAVLKRHYDRLLRAVDAINGSIARLGVKLDGESELAVQWTEPSSKGPVLCRSMMDHVSLERGAIVDLKTCDSSHPAACTSSTINYGYLLQRAAYTSAVAALRPELAGRIDFVFLFAELDPPYAVTAARLDGALREIGEMQWRRAVELWAACMEWNKWPAYASDIITLEAPHWLVSRELGEAL